MSIKSHCVLFFLSIICFTTEVVADSNSLPVPAIIYSSQKAKIASPMAGIIDSMPLKEGQLFKKNEVIVLYNCQSEIANLDKHKAALNKKEVIYNGLSKLHKLGGESKVELLKSKADLEEAKANFRIASYKVKKCQIKAPFDGQVIKKYVEPHEHISVGAPILEIVNINDIEIKIIAPSGWMIWMKQGLNFRVKIFELNNMSFEATVTRYSHFIDPVSHTFKVYGVFDKKQSSIVPGMSGETIFKENNEYK